MTRWGCVPFSNNLYQNICISTKQPKEKCFRHTKDHIDFSLSKKPPSQKFIENSTFNSLVNSRLIIKSYKKGENEVSLVLNFNIHVYRDILISANSSLTA